ncbi:hypothetical protein Tmar_0514 [Thermaerobacter marianensis DSM 12885]|uniref:Uncharacterized protein n=1 Tax=Thermaerobacter marianensis (strain ATCC 700841 / DSM 12885 / JCM 10246 / 7p75a) TaxID=644966 RepID=E6SH04_THEM7|nr:ABC transporter permease [Thermaerobacter marianensis]ADU50635.1 hypothetical protein Tmar_0514 [Thermaerobacter marianensis DSM 12885]
MRWTQSFRAAARYTWTRVRRTWWLPAAVAGGLATGLLTVTQTVAETGVGVLQQAAQFLSFLQAGVMVLAGLAADPERDEDSAAVFWSWPADTAALVLGKLVGAAPLALLAALGAAVPPAVLMASLGRGAGLPWSSVLAEWGLLLAWLVPGALWAAAVGGALGLWLRGLPLFAAILAVWLAGVLGAYLFQALFNPFFPVAWLLQWTGSAMLPPDFEDADQAALGGDLPLLVAHRVLYLAAAGLVVTILALGYRRHRSAGAPVRWGLRLAAGALAVLTVAVAAGAAAVLYARADAGRQELLYYARQGVHPDGSPPPADQVPQFAVTRYQLDVDARRPPELRVDARMVLENRSRVPVQDPTFTLRHVFTVTRVGVEGREAAAVHWTRDRDWIRLDGLVLPPGGSATVTLSYQGKVDQWTLPGGYPWTRMASTSLPDLWHGAHVGPAGLSLPASYGWYPLAGRVTLARALAMPTPAGQTAIWLLEGPATTGSGTIRWPGPVPPEAPAPLEPASFSVTVRHLARYPVLSNLQDLDGPWGPDTRMAGTSTFLQLVGWPLAHVATPDADIWYPAADPGSRKNAAEWASWLREAYTWVGQEVRPRVVTLPLVGTARVDRLSIDPHSGVVMESGSAIMVPHQAMEAVLLGPRDAAGDVESCLVGVVGQLVAWGQPDLPPGPHPCDDLPGGPRAGALATWLRETPRAQVVAALSRLREIAAQRPLRASDLREVMGP